jgi:biotin carboxylase
MRVLLTDGSGLTARQCATILAAAGHAVETVSSDPLCLCRFTRHVRRVHRVQDFAADPFGWLEATLDVYARGRFDVLLPTQEQVAVLAAVPERLRAAGVAAAVPPFEALSRVQDKLAAFATLRELGLPQPPASVVASAAELADWRAFPVYLKTPIGTASTGVRRVESAAGLADLPGSWGAAADATGLLAQQQVAGPLVMVQSVFDRGQLVAFHATERLREGPRGGASHKRSLELPAVRDDLGRLGQHLSWHGALSADVIAGPGGPVFIDINPRLVEPVNAGRAGVDLVGPLLDLARGRPVTIQPPGTAGVRTHQLLLGVLGAAAGRGTRAAVARELLDGGTRRGGYRGSEEELTPRPGRDPRGLVLLAVTAATVLIRPAAWTLFAGGSVTAYALTPAAWEAIREHSSLQARQ